MITRQGERDPDEGSPSFSFLPSHLPSILSGELIDYSDLPSRPVPYFS